MSELPSIKTTNKYDDHYEIIRMMEVGEIIPFTFHSKRMCQMFRVACRSHHERGKLPKVSTRIRDNRIYIQRVEK